MAKLDGIDHSKWQVSSRSSGNGSCVEVNRDSVVRVRDTKEFGQGAILAFDPRSWQAFISWAPDAGPVGE